MSFKMILIVFILNAIFILNVHCIFWFPLPWNPWNPYDEVWKLQDCLELSSCKVEIIVRGTPKYAEFNDHYDVRVISNPKGFLVPSCASDVQCIVNCGQKLKLKLVPKCGGHSFEKYSYGTPESWVIDLRKLNHVHVDDSTGIAAVGAGLTTYEMALKLIPHNYMVSTGTCLDVGISGFTLGGGQGFMVRTYGLMIDRVVEMKMVTADSQLITVNRTCHTDLFWALRGAGANSFGIVTEFKFKLVPLPKVITIVKLYPPEIFCDLFANYSKWAQSEPDRAITPSIYYNFPYLGYILFFAVIESGSDARNNAILNDVKHWFSDVTDDDILYQDYADCIQTIGYTLPKNYFKARTYYVNCDTLNDEKIALFCRATLELCDYCVVLLDMDGGAIRDVTGNWDSAFIHREPCFIVFNALGVPVNTTDPNGVEVARKLGVERLHYLDEFWHKTKSLNSGYSYQNYVDRNLTDWQKRYYGCNVPRIKKISRKYDKDNFYTCDQCY